ncbi:MAG: CRTAC1 family protein [Roseibacillus sp.]
MNFLIYSCVQLRSSLVRSRFFLCTLIGWGMVLAFSSLSIVYAEVISAEPQEILEERKVLDETVWEDEVEAQEYETVFVSLWDRIRDEDGPFKLSILADFPFNGELTMGTRGKAEPLEQGMTQTYFENETLQTFTASKWRNYVRAFKAAGIEVVQTEWHHSRFVPGTETSAPKSEISFAIHAKRESTQTAFAFKGELEVQWSKDDPSERLDGAVPDSLTVTKLKMKERTGGGGFNQIWEARHGREDWISAYPILAYDLDGDGLSEIILPRWNRVYRNMGDREFKREDFLAHPVDIWEAAILSDFNGDGHVDFVTVGKDGSPYFFAGTAEGKFPTEGKVCADVHFDMPTSVTAGDVDGDGDLDLWMAQYKLSFMDGQMPTPYYDANDGPPSYYLENDGNGSFIEKTESVGLAPLRNRRTYSASFVDLDEDGDLDLMNVSDYAGLDIYENTGKGQFELATEDYVDQRHFFGMGHTIGDYNADGLLDFYVIGMSSTTARRLDRLNLGREDRPDVHPMRGPMGYGNRMYYGTNEKSFQEDKEVAGAVARTGWSWGTTSFDFDLDGDQDIYVANGHRSGKSCSDYCSTFWRHDIYTGDSKANPLLLEVFATTLQDLNKDEVSWNGYEKNVLFVNHEDRSERFVNGSFMFGAAHSYDARCVISDDLDGDGRPDLIVAESKWDGRGSALIIRAFGNDVEIDPDNNWISIQLRESAGAGHSPNGAKVAITDDSGRVQTKWIVSGDSFLSQHAPVAHFGLGHVKGVKSVEVTWPNGKIEKHDADSSVNTMLTLRGSELSSSSE